MSEITASVPTGLIITTFLDEPMPCDGCPEIERCKNEKLSCAAFHDYVNCKGEVNLARRGNPTLRWYYRTFTKVRKLRKK